ncbi:MAG: tape measure protein, partial [Lactococcus lactis]|nr:tape measure protein [Lactococcus lactis]
MADEMRMDIELTGNVDGFEKGIDVANKSLTDLKNMVATINKDLKINADVGDLQDKIDLAQEIVSRYQDKVKDLEAQRVDLAAQFESAKEAGDDVSALESALIKLDKEIANANGQINKYAKEMESASRQSELLESGWSDMDKSVKELSTDLKMITADLKLDPTNIEKLSEGFEKSGEKADLLKQQMELISEQLSKADVGTKEYEQLANQYTKLANEAASAERAQDSFNQRLEAVNANPLMDLEEEGRRLGNELDTLKEQMELNPGDNSAAIAYFKKVDEAIKNTESVIDELKKKQDELGSENIGSSEWMKYQDQISKAENEVEKLTKKLGESEVATEKNEKATSKWSDVLTKAAGNLVSHAIESVVENVKELTGEMLHASDATQTFQKMLTMASETNDWKWLNSDAIAKFADDAKEYSQSTVYDFDTISKTMATLASNGVKDFADLTYAVGNANAVFGGSGDSMQSFALAVTQIGAAGKLTTQDWNQITNAVPAGAGALQKALEDAGAYTGNFRDAMSKGQITAEEFNDAILKVGNSDIAIQAASSVDTFEKLMAETEETVINLGAALIDTFDKQAILDALVNLKNHISDAAQTAIDFIGKLNENGTFSTLIDAFKTLGSVVVELTKDSIFGALVSKMSEVSGDSDSLADKIKNVADGFKNFAEFIQDHIKTLENLAIVIGTVVAAMKATEIINGVIKAFKAWKTATEGVTIIQKLMNSTIIPSMIASWKAYATANEGATVAQWALNAAMKANPVGLIVAAVAALIAIIILLVKNWDTVSEVASKVWDKVKEAWEAFST